MIRKRLFFLALLLVVFSGCGRRIDLKSGNYYLLNQEGKPSTVGLWIDTDQMKAGIIKKRQEPVYNLIMFRKGNELTIGSEEYWRMAEKDKLLPLYAYTADLGGGVFCISCTILDENTLLFHPSESTANWSVMHEDGKMIRVSEE